MKTHTIDMYTMTEIREKKMWENAIFIFDSSVLLDLYFFPKETRNEIYNEIFEKNKKRLWIPSHVEYEYLKNRKKIIKKPITEQYLPLEKDIEKIKNKFDSDILKQLENIINKTKKKDKHPHIEQNEIISFQEKALNFFKEIGKFEKEILEQVKHAKKDISDVEQNDDILDSIVKYFTVGQGFTFDEILNITKEGKHRFEFKIPPGYGDLHKNEKKGTQIFADLIIWKQILLYAKEKKLPIIFITNDISKDEDWCYINEKKQITSPREELIKEIYDFANIEFWMYNQSQFLYYSNKYLKSNIEEKVIENVSKILDNKDLISEISSVLFKFDPIGINSDENTDEYDPEAKAILLRVTNDISKKDLLNIIFEEFVHFFNISLAGDKNSKLYSDITTKIWELLVHNNKIQTKFIRQPKSRILNELSSLGRNIDICELCGFKADKDNNILEISHIVPIFKGGEQIASNIQILCPNCNRKIDKERLTKHSSQ